ncbi:sensor histidine kinase, partial [Stappia sp.]|uniref:sensor histidine kinase n=1 Tax=Stappia sp. TaxID=1870903 RepID=UPI003A9948B5
MKARIFESLAFKIVAMLSLALLPLGAIALYQTSNVVRQSDELTISALVGRNLVAVEPQRDLMYLGFAGARVLGNAVTPFLRDREQCHELMRDFIRTNPDYSLAMFVPESGVTSCNSRGEALDLRSSRVFAAFQDEHRPRVLGIETAPVTGEPVLVLAQPVFVNGAYAGFVWLSLPRSNIRLPNALEAAEQPLSLVTFNREGEVLLSSSRDPFEELPRNRSLADLRQTPSVSFAGRNPAGEQRIYTVTPIIRGVVYSLGTWRRPEVNDAGTLSGRMALLFPIIMWLTSLGVAYIAVHRLVVRHVRSLRGKMRRFASGSRTFSPAVVRSAPVELRQMEETFNEMAQTIARDEAELEDGLREKNVLLKEVHHRVKNNLQLIASIMNMEIRKTQGNEAHNALRRVQDRVLGLATVHGNLYHTVNLASVQAKSLLSDILNQTLVSALPEDGSVSISIKVDEVTLFPDQAVPLALLVTEAVSNAVKYVGRPADGTPPRVAVNLERLPDARMRLTIENTVGERLLAPERQDKSTGLGTQLITAFARQLGSRPVIETDEQLHKLTLEMTVAEFEPAA